jgi:hypothetical protein
MKTLVSIFAMITILVSGFLLAGCSPLVVKVDPGPTVTKQYDFTDFTAIEAGYAFEVDVVPSETYKVTITTGEKIFEYIDVSKDGDTLKIDLHLWNIPVGYPKLKAEINMPELWRLNLSGASRGRARGFKTSHAVDVILSGASDLDIDMETGDFESEVSGASKFYGRLISTSTKLEVSGASQIELKGSGGNIKINASGASQTTLTDFPVNDADINLSGASRAGMDISGRLDIVLSGASSLEYEGNPTLGNFSITGGSQMKHKN